MTVSAVGQQTILSEAAERKFRHMSTRLARQMSRLIHEADRAVFQRALTEEQAAFMNNEG